MHIPVKFFIFQIMIILPFICGSIIKGKITNPSSFTKKLIRVNLIVIEPLIALWSIWGLSLSRDVVILPFFGLLLVLIGMSAGTGFSSYLRLTGKRKASFIISSSLANHGFTMGAFFCYLLLGERGLGLSFIFILYFMPYVFLVIFPYARFVSSGHRYDLAVLKDFFLNAQNMPLYAVVVGLFFHAINITRPGIFFPIDILIIFAIALYYFTLGINFTMSDVFLSFRENIALSMIKFLIVPVITLLMLSIVPIDDFMKTIIVIQSFMPAAIFSVIASVLFDLDSKFTSNLFVCNSVIFLLFILPLLFILRGHIV